MADKADLTKVLDMARVKLYDEHSFVFTSADSQLGKLCFNADSASAVKIISPSGSCHAEVDRQHITVRAITSPFLPFISKFAHYENHLSNSNSNLLLPFEICKPFNISFYLSN